MVIKESSVFFQTVSYSWSETFISVGYFIVNSHTLLLSVCFHFLEGILFKCSFLCPDSFWRCSYSLVLCHILFKWVLVVFPFVPILSVLLVLTLFIKPAFLLFLCFIPDSHFSYFHYRCFYSIPLYLYFIFMLLSLQLLYVLFSEIDFFLFSVFHLIISLHFLFFGWIVLFG